jgi:hypothetical protein
VCVCVCVCVDAGVWWGGFRSLVLPVINEAQTQGTHCPFFSNISFSSDIYSAHTLLSKGCANKKAHHTTSLSHAHSEVNVSDTHSEVNVSDTHTHTQ